MEIVNYEVINEFKKRYADSRSALDLWLDVTLKAEWKNFEDVKKNFRTASKVDQCTVFNIKGNHYRLITRISYKLQQVHINTVLTHAEYDKEKWKSDC
jgi:mRNA interferase HigB